MFRHHAVIESRCVLAFPIGEASLAGASGPWVQRATATHVTAYVRYRTLRCFFVAIRVAGRTEAVEEQTDRSGRLRAVVANVRCRTEVSRAILLQIIAKAALSRHAQQGMSRCRTISDDIVHVASAAHVERIRDVVRRGSANSGTGSKPREGDG